ncbi:MAG: VWA domain-containing protein, partial [Methylophaga sp.]
MMLFGLLWGQPWWFLLLPLALLPWFNHNLDKTVAWVELVPVDPLSRVISNLLKLLASVVIVGLLLALAAPELPEQKIERL